MSLYLKKCNSAEKVGILIITIVSITCFILSSFSFYHLLYPTHISFFTTFKKNSFFNFCDILLCNEQTYILKIILNFLILSSFWIQFLVFNNKSLLKIILGSTNIFAKSISNISTINLN